MIWLRRYPRLSLLTVLCAILAFCLADGAVLLGAFGAAVVFIVDWRHRHRCSNILPKLAVNLLVLAAILHAAVASGSSPSGHAVVSDLGRFLVFVQLIKLFDRRSPRDEVQVLSLSLFVVIAAILTSNSLIVGAVLLTYVPLLTLSAMLAQVQRGPEPGDGLESTAGAHPDAAQPPSVPPISSRAERQGDRAFTRLVTRSVLWLFALAAVVFVVAPRSVGENSLGNFGQPRQTTIGFTDTVKLGQSGLISESPRPVLDLHVTDAQGNNLGSPGRFFYLRGSVKEEYIPGQRVWTSTPADLPTGEQARLLTQAFAGSSESTVIVQHIKLRGRPPMRDRLFAIQRPISVTTGVEALQEDLFLDEYNDLRIRPAAPGALPARIEYDVRSQTVFNDPLPLRPLTINAMPELQSIARKLVRDRRIDPETFDRQDPAVVRQVCGIIRDHFQNGYEYTLDLPAPPPNAEPILWFVTTSKRGQCEYFASAMTAMLQSLGVHARLATGYVAGEFNPITGEYLVRESNAHAWVEVHVGGGRWQTYDPTPDGVVERLHQAEPSVLSQIRQWYEVLEFNWSANIVGYDGPARSRLMPGYGRFERLLIQLQSRLEQAGEWVLHRLRVADLGWEIPPAIIPLFPIVILLALIIYRSTGVLARRLSRRDQPDPHREEVERILARAPYYSQALQVLAEAGLAKPASRGLLQHARALASTSPHVAEALTRMAVPFYRVRFGRIDLTPDERALVDRAVADLRAAARGQSTP